MQLAKLCDDGYAHHHPKKTYLDREFTTYKYTCTIIGRSNIKSRPKTPQEISAERCYNINKCIVGYKDNLDRLLKLAKAYNCGVGELPEQESSQYSGSSDPQYEDRN